MQKVEGEKVGNDWRVAVRKFEENYHNFDV